MTSQLPMPTISVTHEHSSRPTSPSSSSSSSSENDDSCSNDLDRSSFAGGVTDVEDFGSQNNLQAAKTQSSLLGSPNLLAAPKRNTDNDVTDVEDYNDDTDSEDEKSKVYPELKLSLQEFLQQGLHEQTRVDNECKQKIEIKAGNFLQAQNLNSIPDYLTDCEDYNTESELEYDDKSVCIDLMDAVGGPDQLCITDSARPFMDADDSDEYEDVSIISDISDLACALADFAAAHKQRGFSEDELLEMSGDEEVCQIAYSCSSSDAEADKSDSLSEASLPAIDVAFIGPNGQARRNSTLAGGSTKNYFLGVAPKHDEVLTDVERLDDSAAEEDSFDNEEEDEKPIPRAIILAPGDDGICQTDTEEVQCEDGALIAASQSEAPAVVEEALPPPHREVIVLKEDKFGDTITNVMPMDDEYQFGIPNAHDDANTDSEDYSCAEGFEQSGALADDEGLGDNNHVIESEITVSNEMLKPQQSKRLELHSNTESVTDVEEIYVAGTNRRKKANKTRQLSKQASNSKANCKFLDVGKTTNEDGGGTDIEDIELSDCGQSPQHKRVNELKQHAGASANRNSNANAEKVTDIEDLTADEVSDSSEHDVPQAVSGDSLSAYTANSSNIVITLETDANNKSGKGKPSKLPHISAMQKQQQQLNNELANQPATDVEDVQLPSDAEELNEPVAIANTCSELNDMLNESYTVVHEKSVRNFDVDAEMLHIKGSELRDAHTDVEYVESDEPAARDGN